MIKNRQELLEFLKYEKKLYSKCYINKYEMIDKFLFESNMIIWKYQKLLRKAEYHYNNKKNMYHLLCYIIFERKKNKLGIRLGITIPINCFDRGLQIFHYGNIVVNGFARIGKNCKLHGGNCIGNNGKNDDAPIIGDNVDIGFGAYVIGNVSIGNNCVIGANSFVNKSFENGSLIVGTPAVKR